MPDRGWTLLIYRLPPQPTRLRIQVWRKLQALGAVYLQDGVAALPTREDLDENLRYIATSIEEMSGSATLLKAAGAEFGDGQQVSNKFRQAADARMSEILARIERIEESFPETHSLGMLEATEAAIKAEKLAYLKARRLTYCGSDLEEVVQARLDRLTARFAAYQEGDK